LQKLGIQGLSADIAKALPGTNGQKNSARPKRRAGS